MENTQGTYLPMLFMEASNPQGHLCLIIQDSARTAAVVLLTQDIQDFF